MQGEAKSSFIMYTEYREHASLLSREQQGDLFMAVMNYAAGDELPELDGMTQMAFSFIKTQMDRDNEKYQKMVEARREAGKKGGRPPKANGFDEKAKKANGFFEKQTKAKKPDNEDDNVDVDDTYIGVGSVKRTKFVPPTHQDVAEYCRERGYCNIDVERFIDFYSSKGWMVGKNKMKDWKAAVRNWARQDMATKPNNTRGNKFTNFSQRQYDYDELERRLLNSDPVK